MNLSKCQPHRPSTQLLPSHSASAATRGRVSVQALLLALAVLVPATASAQEPELVASVEGITEYRLDNGLRVLLFPDQSAPQTTVNITYFVGSRHEGYGETGMAHLLEHMVFKGTPNHPDIPQELSERGALPNGTTWLDRTNYFETFPATSDNLEWALDLEADRMVNSFIAAEDLESEMTVVRNEWESGENSPFGVLSKRMNSIAYLWHNYGNSTIGARADVENVPIERLQAFYRKYYQPDNAQLVVAGQFDTDEALALVVEKFGAIPRPDRTGDLRIYPTYTAEPVQDGERMVTLRRTGDTKLVAHLYHVPAGYHGDFAAVDLLAWVLGNQPSGRLYQALVESGLAASVSAGAGQRREPGTLTTLAVVRDEDSEQDVASAMADAIQEVLTRPVTGEEVERARAARLSSIDRLFNDSRAIALQMSEWGAMGDWRLFFVHRDRLREVSAEDVQRVAVSYLKPSNRTVGFFIPDDDPDRAEIPVAPDVASLVEGYTGDEAVAEGEAFDPSPANIDRRTMSSEFASGMEIALLPKDTRGETVVASVSLRFGNEEALTGRGSAGSLAGSMLMRGTVNRTRQEIQDEMNRLQAQVSVGGGGTNASGRVQATRENFPDALRLLTEILREPSFPEDEFETLKEQQLAALESQRSEPQFQAIIAMQRHMNPREPGHPQYTPTAEESIAQIEALTLDDVRDFYETFYGTGAATMSIVGDFDDAEALRIVEERLGDWAAPVTFARIDQGFEEITPEDFQIETPDKANAFFVAAQVLPMTDDHEDVAALTMANYLLGGGFLNSRLATRIRQEEGLSYGVGSQLAFHPIDDVGQFIAFAIYAPENRDKVEAAFRDEVRKMLEEGFTADEVEAGINGYLENANLMRAQDQILANVLSNNLYFDRTMAWQAEQEEAIRSLTAEQINAAARRWIDPEKMTFVKAGDFANAARVIP
ncbi:MAG: pitrilysin family protein [Gemmatimonadetes bacterium]|nr:pitrilysin family protein [Gemmatimonadota bacterium]